MHLVCPPGWCGVGVQATGKLTACTSSGPCLSLDTWRGFFTGLELPHNTQPGFPRKATYKRQSPTFPVQEAGSLAAPLLPDAKVLKCAVEPVPGSLHRHAVSLEGSYMLASCHPRGRPQDSVHHQSSEGKSSGPTLP